MDLAPSPAITVPLTPAEQDQVLTAAAAAGQTLEAFTRAAVLDAAHDPFLEALEQAADTIAARAQGDRVQHDYAH
jgi:RecA-family ATPase